jgi:hypothetical protein
MDNNGKGGMAMGKMVFFDVDGTLLDEKKKLPASTKAAVRELQKNGIYTAIATGRAPFTISSLLEELNIQSYICFNGQYVVFENEVVYQNPIGREALEKITETAKKHSHSMVYLDEKTVKANVRHDERIAESFGSLKLPHPEYDPEFYKKRDIYQALIFAGEHEDAYLDGFDDVSFIRWHEFSLDIVPKGGSKAEGIKQMINRLDVSMKDVIAFGDGMNDIEMLQEAGTGIAMGNARPIVKEYADFVTSDAGRDGIVRGLQEIGLLPSGFRTVKH